MKKIIPQDAVLIPEEAQCVFRGVIYDVYQWQQKLFDGSESTFEMLRRPDTVSALCVVDDKIIVLTDKQPHRGVKTTFPGGRVDAPEALSDAIRREVHEETGYTFTNWRLVACTQPLVKIEWFIYVYLAWGVEDRAAPHLDAGEQIAVELRPFDVAREVACAQGSFVSESRSIFEVAQNVQELLNTPEFVGKVLER